MNRSLRCGPLLAAVWGLAPRVAHAYVDPGGAGFIITVVLSFLAAFGYVVRGYLRRLKRWIFRGGPEERESDDDARTQG